MFPLIHCSGPAKAIFLVAIKFGIGVAWFEGIAIFAMRKRFFGVTFLPAFFRKSDFGIPTLAFAFGSFIQCVFFSLLAFHFVVEAAMKGMFFRFVRIQSALWLTFGDNCLDVIPIFRALSPIETIVNGNARMA